MTKKQSIDGRGGSFTVDASGEVKANEGSGTLNPGDAGYQEAVRKAPLHDSANKGALNRVPTYRDLDEHTQAAKAQPAKAKPSPSTPVDSPKGGSAK